MITRHPAAPGATYSDAVVVADGRVRWIYAAGQTPREPAPADLERQAEACFRQLAEVLDGHGAGLGDVVQITVYLTQLEDYPSFASVRGRVFGAQAPASATVWVASLLSGVLIEISAVAAIEGAVPSG